MFHQLLSELLRDPFFLSAMSFFINLEAVSGWMSIEKFGNFYWRLLSPRNFHIELWIFFSPLWCVVISFFFFFLKFSWFLTFIVASRRLQRDCICFLGLIFFHLCDKFYICISIFRPLLSILHMRLAHSFDFWFSCYIWKWCLPQ